MPRLETKLISIIIPSLHRPDLTRRCIGFLLKQNLPTDQWEVIVVENDARPDSILADPLPLNTRRILLTDNYGTTGSVNRGVSVSSSRYLLLLNNDVELDPQYIPTLIAAMEVKDYAFATGKLLKTGDSRVLDGAGDALLQSGSSYRLGHGDQDRGQFDKTVTVLTACGAAMLFRRSVFEEMQGLDESFFAYLDDVDLCLRAHLLGHKGVYIPAAVGYHVGSATLGSALHPKVIELLTRNQLLLVIKDYPGGVLVRCLPRIAISQFLWLVSIANKGGLPSYLRGLWGLARALPRSLRQRRKIMANRRISNRQLVELLRDSERQVLAWHRDRPPESRSKMLNVYSWLFGKRT